MKNTLFLSLLLLFFTTLHSETYWQNADKSDVSDLTPQIQAKYSNLQELDVAILEQLLDFAEPFDVLNPYQNTLVQIDIPLPNGGYENYNIFSAPIVAPELAANYPDLNTYMAVSTTSSNYGRIDLTHKGFHAMIFTNEGTYFVDPYSSASTDFYLSYYKKDFFSDKQPHICLVNDDENWEDETEQEYEELNLATPKFGYGEELKTYRAAIAATGEYTQFHGGSVSDALAAIVTSMNRISGVYERDFSITFTIIGDNDQIIYTNPNTDPYTNGNAGAMIGENQTNINNVIGSANYDIGHIFATGGSGLASQGVCSNNGKARGVTGIPQPIGDPYDIDYVSHEIGHQFSASHTFNSTAGSCGGGNRSNGNAFEPGSGTTIMAYAGICSPENTQNNSNDYFHARSFIQIFNYTNTGTGNNCPVKTPTNNNLPEITSITATNVYTIPQSTPFEMNATAVDADGDALTYCWEQYDEQNQSTPINSPSGIQPLFRSFSPAVTGSRVFPQWSDILNNTSTLGERLPDYGRDMNFRVLVRDNRPGAGGVFIANFDASEPPSKVTVSVSATAGPFIVNTPVSSSSWLSGDTELVTWDVAGTNQSPVNCSNVDIYLSVDGGQNFDILLVENVPNNGSAFVVVPDANTNQARVLVKSSDNIFFNVNEGNFEIEVNCSNVDASITFAENLQDALWCENATGFLDFQLSSNLPVIDYQWYKDSVALPNDTTQQLSRSNVQVADEGVYYCEVFNGCETVSTSPAQVEVTNNPIIPVITENNGVLVSSVPYNIQWYLDGVIINGANNQTLAPTQDGAYTVETVAGNCSSTSAEYIATSIINIDEITEVSVVPNPSSGLFTINIANWNEAINFEVIDVIGKKIITGNSAVNIFSVDLALEPNGVYLLKLKSDDYQGVYKLIKK